MRRRLRAGCMARIRSLDHGRRACKRLIDMGLTPDTVIRVERVAPLGDPYIIKVRDYCLAVRRDDLDAIELEQIDESNGK